MEHDNLGHFVALMFDRYSWTVKESEDNHFELIIYDEIYEDDYVMAYRLNVTYDDKEIMVDTLEIGRPYNVDLKFPFDNGKTSFKMSKYIGWRDDPYWFDNILYWQS